MSFNTARLETRCIFKDMKGAQVQKSPILVLEDSYRAIGGGQAVTRIVISNLQKYVVIDSRPQTFQSLRYYNFKSSTKVTKSGNNFNSWHLFLNAPRLMLNILIVMFFVWRKRVKTIYCPSKLGLAAAIPVKLVFRDVRIVFHCHNLHGQDWRTTLLGNALNFFKIYTVFPSIASVGSLEARQAIVIPNPPTIFKAAQFKTPSVLRTFGIVGSLNTLKGQARFLEWFYSQNLIPDLEIRVYGDGPDRDFVSSMANKDPRITYYGHVNDVEEIYHSIDALIILSQEESFSLGVVDAWATRTVVFASTIAAHQELIEHMKNGVLFDPKNPSELLLLIEKIRFNPKTVQYLLAQGEKTYKKLIAHNPTSQLVDLLEAYSQK